MRGMFKGCISLTTVEEIDLTSAVDLLAMFSGCTNLREVRFKGNPKNIPENMLLSMYETMFEDAGINGGTLYYDVRYNYDEIKRCLPKNWTATVYNPS